MIFEYLKINYFVILPTKDCDLDNDQSFFQRFSRRIFVVNPFLTFLEYAPNNIYELFCTRENLIKSRACNPSLSVNFVDDKSINLDQHKIQSNFTVVMYIENQTNNHEKFTTCFDPAPIVIKIKLEGEGGIACDYDHGRLNKELKLIVQKKLQTSQDGKEKDLLNLLQEINANKESDPKRNIISYAHRVFDPLSLVLYECGYDIIFEKMDLVDDIEYYASKMTPLVNAIKQERANLNVNSEEFSNDVVVYCPSVCNYLYNFKSDYWKKIKKKGNITERNLKILKSMIRIRNFSTTKIKVKNEEEINLYDEKDIAPFVVDRQHELNLFTMIMSIFAKSQLVPCIRLPHSIMLHQETLKQIALMITDDRNRSKINSKLIAYSKAIRENIGKTLIDNIFSENKKIVAICDIPIEWLSINNIPIMFSHEISRMPTTPGNLLQKLLTSCPRTYLTYKKICEILIIRSYNDNDPIKFVLEDAIKHKMELSGLPNLNIAWKDVSTKNELIDAINSFDAGIIIFDCHGGHGGIHKHAYLQVGDNPIDIWELSNHCKTSPIVILSSCSTHPIDGSHASVANGLFTCGSLSVVGTYAPVNAVHSSVMITRILFRISSFLRIVLNNTACITWRRLMSGFFRLSYINDILRDMQNNNLIGNDVSNDIEIKTAMLINYYKKDWFDGFIANISEAISKPVDEIKKMINAKYQFTETMLYTQLGRPENIIIYDGDS